MPQIQILVSGARGSRRRGVTACKGCGNAIVWCATLAGKPMPFEEMPDVISVDGDVETVSTEHTHWHCPKAAEFRRRDRGCRGSGGAADLAADVPASPKEPGFEW